ncbi:NADH:flavin oxidoreductase/NADH oxidase [Flavihumibacter fluvii]|uniref:NADH:flavin oxidoreductase/NADH oxidase n=1 Tax=Flavihumibacter fluvii TaxID=2838157 RepID=UPI001BDE5E8C|nr:NADH:flavin oxidoreductase/NADH oxidase [Flavihumibacter fluvii]ULQ50874.1 NADH:flavin oxidoreductase/NADH oxidase [Flavihumibacter fluvii]
MSRLFSPIKIKDISFKNRVAISPMCQYSAVDGFANSWHEVHLGSRAIGGAGLIIQEATAVSPEGRITPGDAGLYDDAQIAGWKKIVEFIHQHGAIAGIQLAHAGRKAGCDLPWKGGHQLATTAGGWRTVAPSALPFAATDVPPEALDAAGIQKVIADFKKATERVVAAGYKVVEIHGAHGYLINSFLSPLTNHRTDEYGGSFENRIRLLLRITEAVQSTWPANYPLFVRISATDWAEGGWTIDDSVVLAGILKSKGVDLIDCSSGGLVPHVKIPVAPGYQVPFAERIKKETGILTGAVGLINTATQAEAILQNDQADLVLFARASLRNPYFPLHAAKELGDDVDWPVQYLRAK